MISLPKQPDSVDPADVLSPIAGSFAVVHAYDACDSAAPWRTYDPAAASGNTLNAIDHRIGWWIRATSATTLPVSGSEPVETTIELCPGWNLIGYPLAQPRSVPNALFSIAGQYLRVYGYDPLDAMDPWEVFDVAAPDWANDLQSMLPGRGYWVFATAATTLRLTDSGPAPDVAIASPGTGTIVTAPTDVIGTVASDLLDGWTLAWRRIGETAFTTFATGNAPVANGRLAAFDPSLLVNGLYEIELTATDFAGLSTSISTNVIVEGRLKIGNFSVSFTDLEVPVAGIPIQVIRTYDSRDRSPGDFGAGWTLSLSQARLQESEEPGTGWQGQRSGVVIHNYCIAPLFPKTVTVTLPGDTVYRFRPAVTPACQLIAPPPAVTLGYNPLPGTVATLAPVDESGQVLVLGAFPGAVELLDEGLTQLADPDRYKLTLEDGRELVIDQSGGLTSIKDLNGNQLTFSRNGIGHSSGKTVTFERDAQGRISKVIDPAGESIEYGYSAAGDLIAVSDRMRQVSRFGYDDSHYLLSIEDPRGIQPIRNEYDDAGRLIRTIDAFGKTIELDHQLADRREVVTDRLGHSRVLEYDARGNVLRETDALGKVTSRTFDDNDQLLSETNALGQTTTYRYDSRRNLTSVRDPLGHTTISTYNVVGQVLSTTDPRGKTTRNTYDSAGNLRHTTDPLGGVTAYTYDIRGNLLTETDAEEAVTTFAYDGYGDLREQTDANGVLTTYTYDPNGNRLTETTTRTLPSGGQQTLVTTFVYDRLGRLTSTVQPDGNSTATVYNAIGKVAETVDPLGRHTTFSYDEMGRQTATRYSDGTSDSRAYDAEGRLVATTDRGGRVTTYLYDAVGRLVRTTFPDTASTTSTYDDAGRLLASTDARNNTTTYDYDAAGRRARVLDALSGLTEFTYDEAGNQVAVTDANRHTTSLVYDDAGRLVRSEYPDGTHRDVEYDELGRRNAETDQAGKITRFGYNALGRLLTVTDALDQVTRYAYDELGNRISQTDANGHTTRFEYDAVGRMTRRVLPDGSAEGLGYDAAGNLTSKADFRGRTIGFGYDLANRLTEKTYPDGTSVAFTYTATGRRLTMVDGRGTTSYTYDSRDRLVDMAYPDGRKLTYEWDANGNRTMLVAHVAGQLLQTRYAYDALNRLDTVTDPRGDVYDHGYDANGNRTAVAYPNGVQTSYTYDPLNRLTGLRTRTDVGTVVASYAYTLGPAGDRTKIEEADGTARTYGYDALYRLTAETVARSGAAVYAKAFAYDPVGNRLQQVHTDGAGTVAATHATYDVRDRQLTRGGQSWSWDANGNLTAKVDEATYAWDFDDRLQQVTLADGTVVAHTYDADGVRVRTETRQPDGTIATLDYLVDATGELSQVVAETSGETVAAYYLRGDDLLALVRPRVAAGTWGVRFYHADGLGSIRALTDEAGSVTDRYAFTAFGELLTHEGQDANAYLFAGEPLDPNSGLYYNRARWMDPGVGRFASVDPFSGATHDPVSLHRYLYVSNQPTLLVDPMGLTSLLNVTIAMAVISTLALNVMTTIGAFTLAAAEDWSNFDGWMGSIRVNFGALPGATFGFGLDLVLDFKTMKVWVAPVGEAGTLPVGIFRTRRGGGLSAAAGPILGMSSPSELSGRGSTAAWPWGILRFLPKKLFSANRMWSWLMHLAKQVKHGRGTTVTFGFSTSGPSFVEVGPGSAFSAVASFTGDFRELGALPAGVQRALQPAVDLMNGLGQLGSDPAAVSENAGEWFEQVLGFD